MKVGDYVRTKGYITKIDSCTCWRAKNQWYISYKLPDGSNCGSAVTDEFKISPNIIDLIEVGDYVNGYLVLNVIDFNDNTRNLSLEKIYNSTIAEEDIKSIVTKEQFESMKYKVGD